MRFTPLVVVLTVAVLGACGDVIGIRELDVRGLDSGSTQGTSPDGAASDPDAAEDGGEPFPIEIDGATPTKRVFITSKTTTGAIGGVQGGDAVCNAAANRTALGGTWVAWLSDDTTSAINRVPDVPYVRLDGELVATGKAQLGAGTLSNPITITEDKAAVGSGLAWTGTNRSGKATGSTCSKWTLGTPGPTFGTAGTPNATDAKWTETRSAGTLGDWPCGDQNHVYCFEL